MMKFTIKNSKDYLDMTNKQGLDCDCEGNCNKFVVTSFSSEVDGINDGKVVYEDKPCENMKICEVKYKNNSGEVVVNDKLTKLKIDLANNIINDEEYRKNNEANLYEVSYTELIEKMGLDD